MSISAYPGPDTIHRFTLDNGITVLVYENNAAESFVVEGIIRAGALIETRQNAGISNFTAEMLTRGTTSRSFEETYEAIEAVGGSIDFGSGRHVTDFSASGLVEDFELLLEMLADSLQRPAFPENQIEKVRAEIIAGLQIQENSTRHMAGRAFRELLYQDHPYSLNVEGYLETAPIIRQPDLREFHRGYYGPQGMIITLVGAIEPEKVLARVEDLFGDWQPQPLQMPEAPPATRPLTRIRADFAMPQKSQSDIVIGLPGPVRAAEDYLEASVANTILGVFGMYGRLGKTVREEQGLAYYAYSRLQGGLGPAPWYVSTGVAPENVEKAIDSILIEMERICTEPIPEEELADTQAYRTGSLPVSLETNDGLAGVILDIELFDLGADYLQKLPDRINNMTPETVQAAARKYLSSTQLAVAVAGPPRVDPGA